MTKQTQQTSSWNADTIVKKSTPPEAPAPDNKKLQSAFKASGALKGILKEEDQPAKKTKERSPMPSGYKAKENGSDVTVKIMVRMIYKKSTPGTHVFVSVDPEAPIPSLYIRKTGLPNGVPKGEIEVTVK